MIKKILKQWAIAVEQYLAGEDPVSICASLGKTTRWRYKWVSRHTPDNPVWFKNMLLNMLSETYGEKPKQEQYCA